MIISDRLRMPAARSGPTEMMRSPLDCATLYPSSHHTTICPVMALPFFTPSPPRRSSASQTTVPVAALLSTSVLMVFKRHQSRSMAAGCQHQGASLTAEPENRLCSSLVQPRNPNNARNETDISATLDPLLDCNRNVEPAHSIQLAGLLLRQPEKPLTSSAA